MYGGIDAFNALMTEQRRGLSLAEVMRQHDEVHARLLALRARRAEPSFRRRTRACAAPAARTYGHYPVHAKAIRAWRGRVAS